MTRVVIYKSCNRIVANQPGVKGAVEAAAHAIAAVAAARLAAHRHDGHSQILVTHGPKRLNWYIVLDDTRGDWAAAAIEFGTGRSKGINVLGGAIGGD